MFIILEANKTLKQFNISSLFFVEKINFFFTNKSFLELIHKNKCNIYHSKTIQDNNLKILEKVAGGKKN